MVTKRIKIDKSIEKELVERHVFFVAFKFVRGEQDATVYAG